MTQEEINAGNELIVKFMGYIYKYDAYEDFSDIGGLYSDVTYYSKEPLKFEFTHDDGRGEGLIRQRADESYIEFITVITGGYGRYMLEYDSSLRYHESWDWLMPVVEKIYLIRNIELELMLGSIEVAYIGKKSYRKYTCVATETGLSCWFLGVADFIKWYNENKSEL